MPGLGPELEGRELKGAVSLTTPALMRKVEREIR